MPAFGAQVFAGAATQLVNRVQAADLDRKGAGCLRMFRGLSDVVARHPEREGRERVETGFACLCAEHPA